jgi:hypothetical protein
MVGACGTIPDPLLFGAVDAEHLDVQMPGVSTLECLDLIGGELGVKGATASTM